MADRELKLNSLSRYSKESPLFILEEHGHCEVPAGCGGVVLRWRDPRAGTPLTMRMYAAGECAVALDGQAPPSARSVVPFGDHVLGFIVTGVDPAYLVLMFVAANEPPERRSSRVDDPVSVVTAADGTWRYTAQRPADAGWMHAGFDDRGWREMRRLDERRPPEDPQRDYDQYAVRRLTEAGAVGLGVDEAADAVWIRREFTLHAPDGGPAS